MAEEKCQTTESDNKTAGNVNETINSNLDKSYMQTDHSRDNVVLKSNIVNPYLPMMKTKDS